MRVFNICVHILLLFTTPTLLATPPQSLHIEKVRSKKLKKNFRKKERYLLVSYDEVLKLLSEIESGKAEKKYRSKDINRINRFLAFLAQEGALTQESSLAIGEDIDNLLYTDCEYSILPASNHIEGDVELCGWFSNSWKKTKKFVRNHKKEIVIGAVIVIGIVVVISTASAGAGAVGAVGAAAASKDEKPKVVTDKNPLVEETVHEHVSQFKEFLSEDSFMDSSQEQDVISFGEKARELGSYFAHQAFEELSELASIVPKFCEELKDVGSHILPEDFIPSNPGGNPEENFERLVLGGHQTIDKAFSTKQAELYSPENRGTKLTDQFATGVIPLPSGIPKLFSNTKKLSESGKALDRAGFTKAGRGLMKHGYREGSVYPKPVGNPHKVNEQGQKVLESILNHPERQIFQNNSKNLGEIVDICAPGIGGVRYSVSGEMIGFLEP